MAARYRRIHAVVAAIPAGAVASYGQVALRAGLPRGARQVGRALAQCPAQLPWHRVVNAAGRIALPPASAGFREQVRRLRAEGIEVRDGRVPRRLLDGGIQLDALLWGPAAHGEAGNDEHGMGNPPGRDAGAGGLRRAVGGPGRNARRQRSAGGEPATAGRGAGPARAREVRRADRS
ncbi:MAG: MGMT family protein [Gammaproteobacteria bacterium]|nr:MAG: MGMT family protein [Gammaproteobacteria bacterium]